MHCAGLVNLANLELSMLARGSANHSGSANANTHAAATGGRNHGGGNTDGAVGLRAPTSVREHLVVGFFRLLSVGMVWIGAQVLVEMFLLISCLSVYCSW